MRRPLSLSSASQLLETRIAELSGFGRHMASAITLPKALDAD
jgi:hypothetical protein